MFTALSTFGIVKWILIALFIAGLCAAAYGIWTGFTGSYEMVGAQKQAKADEAEITTANDERNAAVQRASVAEATNASTQAAMTEQTTALLASAKSQAAAEKAAREIAIKYANAVAAGSARDAMLAQLAKNRPADGRTCEQVLSATDKILRDSARIRQAP